MSEKNDWDQPAEAPRAAQAAAAPSKPDSGFPNDLRKSFALLQEAENKPAKSPQERTAKAKLVADLKAHIFRLQQHMPVVQVDSKSHGHEMGRQRVNILRERMNMLGRQHPEIRDLVSHDDKVTRALADATLRITELETQIANLTKK